MLEAYIGLYQRIIMEIFFRITQLTFTYSKSTIETVGKSMKDIQS